MLRAGSVLRKWPERFPGGLTYVGSKTFCTKFFNRSNELNYLLGRLKSIPSLSVLTGPINSGKSMIITELIDDLKRRNVPRLID